MNQLHRRMGTFALMMVGLGSMIGSGWLFGAWRAAQIAGPAAIISWIIGMIVILFIALSYSELGSMFPEAGGMVKYTQYSHGSFIGFIAGWANWIAIVSVIPVEAVASVQYELMAVGLGKVDKQSRSQRHTYGRGARLRIRIADYLLFTELLDS